MSLMPAAAPQPRLLLWPICAQMLACMQYIQLRPFTLADSGPVAYWGWCWLILKTFTPPPSSPPPPCYMCNACFSLSIRACFFLLFPLGEPLPPVWLTRGLSVLPAVGMCPLCSRMYALVALKCPPARVDRLLPIHCWPERIMPPTAKAVAAHPRITDCSPGSRPYMDACPAACSVSRQAG